MSVWGMLSIHPKDLPVIGLGLVLIACAPTAPRQLDPQALVLSEENAIPPATAVPLAFEETDSQSRRTAVISAVRRFLLNPAYSDLQDEIVSQALTDLAFSSGRLTLPDPAFVQKQGPLVAVAIPDGIGLYFYDLSNPHADPIELSQWTAGIQSLEATWTADKVVLVYYTLDTRGVRHAHVSLITHGANSDWTQSWISDDVPDWWFNATNATVEVAPDLSHIVVDGEATSTTHAFQEVSDSPQRRFRLVWELADAQYRLTTPSTSYRDRSEWAWATAIPSPYATLVEFVERFQQNDQTGARLVAASDAVIVEARDFGLTFSGVPYKVETVDATHLLMTGYQGQLVITFEPPQTTEGRWLITNITPQGASVP